MDLLEKVLSRDNLKAALKRVEANKGAPGVDGVSTEQLRDYLRQHWTTIRSQIEAGTYKPSPVRRVEIPKPDGGVRLLGIPTVVDRLIQQAILQVLTPIFDPEFSDSSFGFRPKRRAHDAVRKAQQFINEGYRYVVDIDLEKFFDRVNHDILMSRVARKVKDKRLLKLIRAIRGDGQRGVRDRGRGNTARWPLKSALGQHSAGRLGQGAGEEGTPFLPLCGRLQYLCPFQTGGRIRLHPKSIIRLKERIRQLTNPHRSISMQERIQKLNQSLMGWIGYFALAEAKTHLLRIEEWIRRRLRLCLWTQWKRVRTRYRELRSLGISHSKALEIANTRKGAWRTTKTPHMHKALGIAYWQQQGLMSLVQRYFALRQA